MNFIQKVLSIFSSKENNIKKELEALDTQESKLNESLTNLIFQQGKLKEKRRFIISELEEIAVDLDQLIDQNDEEAAIYLLEKTDRLKSDVSFIDSELVSLQSSIDELVSTKNDLSLNKDKYKNLLYSQNYKLESLKAKKEIRKQISGIDKFNSNGASDAMTALEEKILKTQAEIEVMDNSFNPIEKRLAKQKRNRLNQKYVEQFKTLKSKREVLA